MAETRTHKTTAEVRIEAAGLHEAFTEGSFLFLARVMHNVLGLMDPPNKMLQATLTDLLTAVQLIHSVSNCRKRLRCDEEFLNIWNENSQ